MKPHHSPVPSGVADVRSGANRLTVPSESRQGGGLKVSIERIAESCSAGIIVVDDVGVIRYANGRAQSMLSLESASSEYGCFSAQRWRLSDFDGRLRAEEELLFARVIRTRMAIDNVEHRVERANGTKMYLRVSGQPLCADDGSPAQAVLTMVEASEAIAPHRQGDQRFEQLIENLREGVVHLDATFRVVFVNPRIAAMLGCTREELHGRLVYDLFPDANDMRERMLRRRNLEREDYETTMSRSDGSTLDVSIAASPLMDANGQFSGSVAAITDITERKRQAAELKDVKDRLEATLASLSEGVTVTDSKRIVRYCNQSGEEILGVPASAFVGVPGANQLWAVSDESGRTVPPDETPVARTLASGRPCRNETLSIQDTSGRSRWLLVNTMPQYRPSEAQPHAVVASFTDITHLKQTELDLRASQARLEMILQRAPIGMTLVSLDGRFQEVNEALCQIVGYGSDELKKLTFQQITHPDDLETDLAFVRQLLADEIPHYQMEKRYFHRSGHVVWVHLTVGLIRDAAGRPMQFISQIKDITQRHSMQRRLAASEERLRRMLDSVEDEFQMLDPAGNIIQCNAATQAISAEGGRDLVGCSIAPFYGEGVAGQEHVRTVLASAIRRERHQEEVRLRRASGDSYMAKVVVTALHGDDGSLLGFCRVTQDLTARHQAENERTLTRQRLEQHLAQVQQHHRETAALAQFVGVMQSCVRIDEILPPLRGFFRSYYGDCSGVVYLHTGEGNRLEAVLNWGSENPDYQTIEPIDCWALRRGQTHVVLSEDHQRCGHLPESAAAGLCVPLLAQNEVIGVLTLNRPERIHTRFTAEDDQRRIQLAAMAGENIAMAIANIRLREKLHQQSVRDPLTGLYNRRQLEEAMQKEFERCRRGHGSMGVLLVDVDHFKRFNDQFGHDAGDAALVAICGAIHGSSRITDVCCRYGGEEIVVLLPNTDECGTAAQAERLRKAVEETAILLGARSLPGVTVSIGVGSWRRGDISGHTMLTRADQALYAAKADGRNRVGGLQMKAFD